MGKERDLRERIEMAYAAYSAYDSKTWIGEFFDRGTGGYVVTHFNRKENAGKSGNERSKYYRELFMAKVLAKNGYHVEMLEENSRQKSHDINLDGIPAELKKIESIRKIHRRAKEAKEQGAKIIVFQIEEDSEDTYIELSALKQMRYEVVYFFTGKEKLHKL